MLAGGARRGSLDLKKQASVVFGAPPLLSAEGAAGRERGDADVLEFLRRARGQGHASASIDMEEIEKQLGAKGLSP